MAKNKSEKGKMCSIYGSFERNHGNTGRMTEESVLDFKRGDIWLFL